MNTAWISEMFVMEPVDVAVLESFEDNIAKGAQVFFALDDEETVMAYCMILPLPNGEWEIEKFCARGLYTGTGAGSACFKACLDYAKERQVEKVVIVSNRKCVHAVRLYRKFGFTEVPVDKEKFPFDRADIAFEQVFQYE